MQSDKKSVPQTLKGFRDFLPEEAIKREWLRDKLKEIFEVWGYDPMETPTLEMLELFEGQIGEEEKLFFKFQDPGGRNVALRYDQTVPTCRVIGQYSGSLPMPFRRYQIQPAFRAEKPQKGRYREFLQCDADIFGISSPNADAEVIALSLDIYRQLGFKNAQVLINDRALLKDIPYTAISAIDKLKKVGEEGVIKNMEEKGITVEDAKKYLEKVKSLVPNQTISVILRYLGNMGFDDSWYKFEPTLARSFSYSTGPIWEVVIPEYGSGSVLGGERYDDLVKKISGKEIPGTGFAVGFDRTLEAAEIVGLVTSKKTSTQALVSVFSTELEKYSLEISQKLREEWIKIEMYPDNAAKLEKQIKYAVQKGIPYVIIAGPEEAEKKCLVIKNLSTGTQKTIDIKTAAEILKV
jgi:histidyl-tRNA synthetase